MNIHTHIHVYLLYGCVGDEPEVPWLGGRRGRLPRVGGDRELAVARPNQDQYQGAASCQDQDIKQQQRLRSLLCIINYAMVKDCYVLYVVNSVLVR